MKHFLSLIAFILFSMNARAQTTNKILLWTDNPPGALGKEEKDIPSLKPFFADPATATGAAMIVCPGGGYAHLAEDYEGKDYALWLNSQGITAFVLKYRLGSAGYRHPIMLGDAARAIRLIRTTATALHLDPKRIGIMGSSAGGHLAATLLTHFDAGDPNAPDLIDRQSCRPDLGILCYPVITMGEKTHRGSRENLLGKDASPELIQLLSNELHVTKDTPPCFLFHSASDKAVPVENSLLFAEALARAGVPFDLHIYEKGQHGTGLAFAPHSPYDLDHLHPWTKDCEFWLKERGFAK